MFLHCGTGLCHSRLQYKRQSYDCGEKTENIGRAGAPMQINQYSVCCVCVYTMIALASDFQKEAEMPFEEEKHMFSRAQGKMRELLLILAFLGQNLKDMQCRP